MNEFLSGAVGVLIIVSVWTGVIFLFIALFLYRKKITKFCKKYQKLLFVIIFIAAVVALIVICCVKIYHNIESERQKRGIITYCDGVRWVSGDKKDPFFGNFTNIPEFMPTVDEWGEVIDIHYTSCKDFLYIKPKVKKSNNGICHDEYSNYYYQTKIYQIFDSMEECFRSGGRRPYN